MTASPASPVSTGKTIRLLKLTGYLLIGSIPPLAAEEVPVNVPNQDFEAPANAGSIGASGLLGLLNPSHSSIPLGAGPWDARSSGVAGLLLAPAVRIAPNGVANGYAEIAGLAHLQLLNQPLLNNRASLSQTLTEAPEGFTLYTLEADVDCSAVVSVTALAQAGIGIGLTVNGTQVASSLTSAGEFLSLELINGSSYRLRVRYATEETPPAGAIGIRLFAGEGAGLVQASVLTKVTFDNVRLTAFKLES